MTLPKRFATSRAKEILEWYQHSLNYRSALANANMALVVAMANPMDLETVDTLRFQTAMAIEVAVAVGWV